MKDDVLIESYALFGNEVQKPVFVLKTDDKRSFAIPLSIGRAQRISEFFDIDGEKDEALDHVLCHAKLEFDCLRFHKVNKSKVWAELYYKIEGVTYTIEKAAEDLLCIALQFEMPFYAPESLFEEVQLLENQYQSFMKDVDIEQMKKQKFLF